MRNEGLNSKIIVMNVDRYKRGYDAQNRITWRGFAFLGYEMTEIANDGIEAIIKAVPSYFDSTGRRTLRPTPKPAPTVLEVAHIPWEWIEDIVPEGDEFDGAPIFFVRYRAPGRKPFNRLVYRESQAVPFGPHDRDYYPPAALRSQRPRRLRDWWAFGAELRTFKAMDRRSQIPSSHDQD